MRDHHNVSQDHEPCQTSDVDKQGNVRVYSYNADEMQKISYKNGTVVCRINISEEVYSERSGHDHKTANTVFAKYTATQESGS